jgi:subtilisin-like proprotein convertase family protein
MGAKESFMDSFIRRATQTVALAGLAVTIAATSALPLVGWQPAAAGRDKHRQVHAESNARGQGGIHAQLLQSFSNSTPLTTTANTTAVSEITVSGFQTPIGDVDVSLNNLNATLTGDLDLLLVGPQGQTAMIMSDMGGNNPATNVSLVLDDQSSNHLLSFQPLTSGQFQPANFDNSDPFQSPPAPTANPSSGSALGVFNGTDANGTWRLLLHDDTANTSTQTINGGWSLRITSANGGPLANGESYQANAGLSLSIPAASGVLANDTDPDNDALTVKLVQRPAQGSVDLQPDGGFTYTPNKTANGSDSFTYLVKDPDGQNAQATADFQITKAKKKHKKRKH